jgi:hypothetical protein
MSAEDPRVANARQALAEADAAELNGQTVWSQHGILASSLQMLLTYVDGESFDEWNARVTAEARR